MAWTIEVLVDGQQTGEFDEEDILEEFIERVQRRAAEPDSPQMFVVPLPELFGLSVDDSEKCVVIVVDDLLPRDIPIQCEYFCVDVQVKRNGKSATSLVLAGGHVIISGDIVPEIWHEDDGRLVTLWLFRNSNAWLCEYFYHNDIDRAFSMTFQVRKRSNEARDEAKTERTAMVFDRFQTLCDSKN
jgi:hypothetical protein